MRSLPEFLAIAVVVTLTPGPATVTVLAVAARDGRRAAVGAIAGNSAGVLLWGCLSAAGVSSLILASEVARDALRLGGALVLVALGVRSLLGRRAKPPEPPARRRAGWRSGLVTSVSNPKLAVFFVALFPQFLEPGAAVLPYALAMAAAVVAFDVCWFSLLVVAVDRARRLLRRRVETALERVAGAVLVGLGLRLALEAR